MGSPDIDRIAALEDALRQAEARAAALYDHAPDPILEVDAAGAIVGANATARLRLPAAEEGRPLASLFAPPGDEHVARAFGQGLDDSFDGELVLVTGRVVLLRAVPIATSGAVVALRDVSERVALREHLEQGRRDATLGRIAGGIAHAVNNPLTVLQLRTDLLIEDARLPRDLRRQLEFLRENTQRIARIVRSLQQLARPPAPFRAVQVGHVVDGAVDAARAHLPHAVSVEPGEEAHVAGDRESLALAVEQLLYAATVEGPATVRVRATEAEVAIEVVTPAGAWPDAVVADPSAPPDGLVGRFTIAIATAVARDHGGHVRLSSRPGGGGSLALALPRAKAARPPAAQADRAGPARVLVVDDEPLVASVIADFCRHAGHTVEVAPSAEDAMHRLGVGPTVDVVLADDRLPGTSGRDLLAWVVRHQPELSRRVALMSGGEPEPGDPPFLPKPFTRHQLQQLVDALLGP